MSEVGALSDTASEKKQGLLSGFKQFMMRGNVVDLAVAVVIGAAFTNIVNSVVNGVINPVVGAFGTKDLAGYTLCIKAPCTVDATGKVTQGVAVAWGSVLGAVLNFLITAAVVYFLMVVPMSRFLARRTAKLAQDKEPEPAEETPDIVLLREIRDALRAQSPGASVVAQRSRSDAGSGPGPGSGSGEEA
ncbi:MULTISPECIES: large conductance mechanosensitive channel protein MscL [Streptomycetaceae]|nr:MULTISPECIES: large conductance mechanosensitive channel protein MscL [Streptomycetaceae]